MSNSSTAPVTIKQGYDDGEVEYVRKDSIPTLVKDAKHGYFPIGKQVLIRTVTMIDVGMLIDITDTEFVLSNASWIADTGRWSDCLSGKIEPKEVEPFPNDKLVFLSRGSYVDMVEYSGNVSKQK